MRVQNINQNSYQNKNNFKGRIIKFSPELAIDADLIGVISRSDSTVAGLIKTLIYPIKKDIPGFETRVLSDAPLDEVATAVNAGKNDKGDILDLSEYKAYIGR